MAARRRKGHGHFGQVAAGYTRAIDDRPRRQDRRFVPGQRYPDHLAGGAESEARRLVDFASGLSQGLEGRIERVTSKVFLLSPAHVATSGDAAELEPDVDAAFLARD